MLREKLCLPVVKLTLVLFSPPASGWSLDLNPHISLPDEQRFFIIDLWTLCFREIMNCNEEIQLLAVSVLCWISVLHVFCVHALGIIPGIGSANERRRYNVTSSHIGWARTQNGPCFSDYLHASIWYMLYLAELQTESNQCGASPHRDSVDKAISNFKLTHCDPLMSMAWQWL